MNQFSLLHFCLWRYDRQPVTTFLLLPGSHLAALVCEYISAATTVVKMPTASHAMRKSYGLVTKFISVPSDCEPAC